MLMLTRQRLSEMSYLPLCCLVINIYCFSFRNVLGYPGMKITYTTSACEFAEEGDHFAARNSTCGYVYIT